jgi:VWFA-related protein
MALPGRALAAVAAATLSICLSPAQDSKFHAESRVVLVPVTVTDDKGKPIDGLGIGDFSLLDHGARQRIALDVSDTGVAPISLVIAIQTAGVSAAALAKIRKIGGMIQPLIVGDRGEAAVLTFDSEIRWARDFTSESRLVRDSFEGLRAGEGMTARMLDALVQATARMRERKGRRIVVIVSESRDRGSKTKLVDAVQAVQRADVLVYAAKYSAYTTPFTAKPEDLPPPDGPNLLAVFTELGRMGKKNTVEALTQATGGNVLPFLTQNSLEKAIEKLGEEVHSQYLLSFTPESKEAGFHRIEVQLAGHGNVRVRWRQAYWNGD